MNGKGKNKKSHSNRQNKSKPRCGSQKKPTSLVDKNRKTRFTGNLTTLLKMNGLPALLSMIVYVNTLWNKLVYDDSWTMGKLFLSDLSLSNFFNMRGLTYTVHRLDLLIWRTWLPGFHLTNLLLHSLASTLAASVAYAMTRSRRIGLICGLIFAIHPVHTEVVASFAYRKDILAMIFVSLALILWFRAHRPLLSYAGSFFCFGLAVLSKEVAAVGLPLMLFLIDMITGQKLPAKLRARFGRATLRLFPFAMLIIIYMTSSGVAVSRHFSSQSIQLVTKGQCQNYEEVLATAAASVPTYFRLMIFPDELSADYLIQLQKSIISQKAIVGLTLVLTMIVALLLMLKLEPVAGFAIAWMLLMFLPCSNIVPLTHFFIADRYLYVPSFGFCLLLAFSVDRILVYAKQKRLAPLRFSITVFVILIITAGSIRSIIRNGDWYDSQTLWTSAVQAGMNTFRAHSNLGTALANQGEYEGAIRHYTTALHIKERYYIPSTDRSNVHSNLGAALAKQGKLDEAIEQCYAALEIDSNFVEARNNLGCIFEMQGLLDSAIEHYSKAFQIAPQHLRTRAYLCGVNNKLGIALEKQGKFDEAVEHYNKALSINPNFEGARHNLNRVRRLQNRE